MPPEVLPVVPPPVPEADVPLITHGDDRVMLEGPRSRTRDMWLLYHVAMDFLHGFRRMHVVGPCVTV